MHLYLILLVDCHVVVQILFKVHIQTNMCFKLRKHTHPHASPQNIGSGGKMFEAARDFNVNPSPKQRNNVKKACGRNFNVAAG